MNVSTLSAWGFAIFSELKKQNHFKMQNVLRNSNLIGFAIVTQVNFELINFAIENEFDFSVLKNGESSLKIECIH